MACFCLGRASFEAALRKGDVPGVLAHLEEDPLTTARTVFRNGDTLWHVAAASGHLPLLQALAGRLTAVWPTTEAPASNGQDHPHHQHAPFQRRSNPFQRISDGLRGRGPDASQLPLAAFLNTPNLLGRTALMTACQGGHPGCVHFLLSMGANPWYRDRANFTPLHFATLHDQGPCIEAVLQHPASARPPQGTRQSLVRLVDLPNFSGYTPAHVAAIGSKARALAALLACGANIAARCWSEGNDWISGPPGSTPLHLAARRGDEAVCKLIMRHYLEVLRDSGAPDPRLHADSRGLRPYQSAAERGNDKLAEMLMPSTPLTYIFGSFGSDVVRLYKVPKLKALASAALQAALLNQINELQVEAAERRRLATEAAVAVARAAAAAVGGGLVASPSNRPGSSTAFGADAGASSMSRGSSLVNGALQFVRRQSLRPLNSLRQRLRTSGRWLSREPTRDFKGASQRTSTPGGALESVPGGLVGYNPDARTISGISGVDSFVAATPGPSGMPPPAEALAGELGPGADSELTTAAVTAVASSAAPLLGAGSERSASVGPPPSAVADGAGRGALKAGSGAGAVLGSATAAAAAAVVGGGGIGSLPGGISPVRGSSFESDQLPFLPAGSSPKGHIQPQGRGAAAAASIIFPGSVSVGHDPSVGAWAVLNPSSAAADASGCGMYGSSPTAAPALGAAGRPSDRPVSLPLLPTPPPQLQPAASPFALPALQSQPLSTQSGTPAGGSPTCSVDGNASFGRCASGRPPPLPAMLSFPGGAPGLQPVWESRSAEEGGDDGGGGQDNVRARRKASKYAMPQSPPMGQGVRGAAGLEVCRSVGLSGAPDMQRLQNVAAGIAAGYRASGEYSTRKGLAGCSGADPAGGSPRSGAFLLPGTMGRDTCGSGGIGGFSGAGAGAASRHASGRPQASGGSGTCSAAVPAAATGDAGGAGGAAIGSDTSEDYCGVCFERAAILYIKPCRHNLCAECSREVTRMVETQPPSCPFCRGVVRGFGC